jgi:SAM-dependent methyltransferase
VNLDLLDLLACPACGGDLAVADAPGGEGATLEEGRLDCASCGRHYPVVRGIPRLLVDPPEGEVALTAESFGRSWGAHPRLDEIDRRQFLDWIHPVTPPFFDGKTVLELGCGKGRHSRLAATFGAGRVVSVDLSSAVEVARQNTRDLPQVDIVQADIMQLPFKPARFDYAWSVGVLHHLPHPFHGFRSLARQVRPGGHVSAWVYGREGNDWIVAVVDPLRKALRRAPFGLVRALSKVLTWPLYLLVHGLYSPLNALAPGLARRLFYADYFLALADHRFSGVECIVLDQLIAPTTHYVRRGEFLDWFARMGLPDVRTSWLHANSWRGFAQVPETGLQEAPEDRRFRQGRPRPGEARK